MSARLFDLTWEQGLKAPSIVARVVEDPALSRAEAIPCGDDIPQGDVSRIVTEEELSAGPILQNFAAYPCHLILRGPWYFESSYGAAISQKGYQAWHVIEHNKDRIKIKLPGEDWKTIFLNRAIASVIWVQ